MTPYDPQRDGRPDPDALLAMCERRRGRLKVFLGAAPGVGKTFAMLSQARALRHEGVDVVVGVAETHGRSETAALIEGLEVLPRRRAEYRGHVIEEFDIDAALARRPALIVIDELAHTNAPDSRHPKRFQDVEEVLEAGIDVWTALNIQHLESLSDVVSKISGVTVRETVPDTVIEKAHEVVVVDITPTELLQRLRDGKVYLPDNARRAADHFFKPGNLTALRELALRRTADRVDDQMVDYLRQNAIEGPWPTAERILVCVGGDAQSEAVVRAAGRLANGLNATWVAVHLETEGQELTDETSLRRVDETMRLAERLGAETARLAAKNLPEALLRFARRENTTQIVLGRSRGGWWTRARKRALSDAVLDQAVDVAVHVITDARAVKPATWRWPRPRIGLAGSLVAAGSVAAVVLIGQLASHWLKLPNLSMIFLAAVLLSAIAYGVWAAILASVLSFFAYNFFFIEPIYTLTIAEPHELFALVIFLMVAVFTGGLAGRVREQSDAVRRRIAVTQSLYDISHKLSGTAALDEVLWVVASHLAAAVKGQAMILLGEAGELSIRAAFPPEDSLGPSEWAAARWAFERGEIAGRHSSTLPNALYQFRPIRTTRGVRGAIGFVAARNDRPLAADEDRAVEALLDQAAVAIERTLLVEEAAAAAAAAEREKLRDALLSSISHDLRTPLASIVGAVTSLRQLGERMPRDARDDLLAAIEEESARMSRFVSNLLDMTRVESGALDVRHDWVDVGDAVRGAVARARKSFAGRQIDVAIDGARTLLIRGDTSLLETIVFNLLDNADKYAPAGTPTAVTVEAHGDAAVIAVTDQGSGVAADEIERIFEKFYRVKRDDGRAPGTGLGLAICRGLTEAMGGDIRAESPVARGRGTRLTVRLPLASAAPAPATSLEAQET